MINSNKKKLSSVLFYLSLGMYLTLTILNTSFYHLYLDGTVTRCVLFLCLMVMLIRELLLEKVQKKDWTGIILLFITFIIMYRISKLGTTMMLIYIYGARNVGFKKIAILSIWVTALTVLFVIISSYIGIVDNYIEVSGNRVREYIGFKYALFPSMYMLNITFMFVYLCKNKTYKDKLYVIFFIAVLASNFWFYVKTDSKTNFYLAILMLMISLFFNKNIALFFKNKIIKFLSIFSYVISAFISFLLTIKFDYGNQLLNFLNRVLANRLRLGQQSLERYGVNLFGQNIKWVGNGLNQFGVQSKGEYNYVDSLYIQILQKYGFVFFIVFLVVLSLFLYKLLNEKEYHIVLILVIVSLHSIIDNLSLYIWYNTFFIAIGYYLAKIKWDTIDIKSILKYRRHNGIY